MSVYILRLGRQTEWIWRPMFSAISMTWHDTAWQSSWEEEMQQIPPLRCQYRWPLGLGDRGKTGRQKPAALWDNLFRDTPTPPWQPLIQECTPGTPCMHCNESLWPDTTVTWSWHRIGVCIAMPRNSFEQCVNPLIRRPALRQVVKQSNFLKIRFRGESGDARLKEYSLNESF